MRQIASLISKDLGVATRVVGRDYNPALWIVLDIEERRPRLGSLSISFVVLISSKARFYGFYCHGTGMYADIPAPIPRASLRPEHLPVRERIERLLDQLGYQQVPESVYGQPCEGCLTELDDLPANVFQALFSETL